MRHFDIVFYGRYLGGLDDVAAQMISACNSPAGASG